MKSQRIVKIIANNIILKQIPALLWIIENSPSTYKKPLAAKSRKIIISIIFIATLVVIL